MTQLLTPPDVLTLHQIWQEACASDSFLLYTSTLRLMGIIDREHETKLDLQCFRCSHPNQSLIFRHLRLTPGQLLFRPVTEHTLTASCP